MFYRLRYVSVRGNQLTLTLAEGGKRYSPYRKFVYGNPEDSIRKKMILLYTQMFQGKFVPTRNSNVHEVHTWVMHRLFDHEILEDACDCDRRYGTRYSLWLFQNAAACLIHNGIWTNRDLSRVDRSAVLSEIDGFVEETIRKVKETTGKYEQEFAGCLKLSHWEESAAQPGWIAGRVSDSENVCLARCECVSDSGWVNSNKGMVLVYEDAPDGVYAVLAYGDGKHVKRETREYLTQKKVGI